MPLKFRGLSKEGGQSKETAMKLSSFALFLQPLRTYWSAVREFSSYSDSDLYDTGVGRADTHAIVHLASRRSALKDVQAMKYARIALFSAAATCLLPFATPAIAEVGYPSGCARCGPVNVVAPSQGYYQAGIPVLGPLLEMGVPAGAVALAPETSTPNATLANGCHVEVWAATYPREYHTVCP